MMTKTKAISNLTRIPFSDSAIHLISLVGEFDTRSMMICITGISNNTCWYNSIWLFYETNFCCRLLRLPDRPLYSLHALSGMAIVSSSLLPPSLLSFLLRFSLLCPLSFLLRFVRRKSCLSLSRSHTFPPSTRSASFGAP